jgi:catechol 2,3-dioxygenase-like lactoylglutathione lyase family enzyme
MKPLISGAHVIVYSRDAEADRAFFKTVLGLDSVDSGGGWLIFALPPSEVAFHPTEEKEQHELYLLCDDIEATARELERKGVPLKRPFDEARWGHVTEITLPGGGKIGLYQPKHPLAHAKTEARSTANG